MERSRPSHEKIIKTMIARGFQLVQSGERCENYLGQRQSKQIGVLYSAVGIDTIKMALSEAELCGIILPEEILEPAKKILEKRGAWADKIIGEEALRIQVFGIRNEFIKLHEVSIDSPL